MPQDRFVYVVDHDPLAATAMGGLLRALDLEPRSFPNAIGFLDHTPGLSPGCVLLDLHLPDMSGLELLEAFAPSQMMRFPVIMMTSTGDIAAAVRAMKLGASDFLQKPIEKKSLFDALNWGWTHLDLNLAAAAERERAMSLVATLSPREKDVLDGLVAGLPNKQLAHRLHLSVRTVEMHRGRMMDRLGVGSISEAMWIAFKAGIDAGLERSV